MQEEEEEEEDENLEETLPGCMEELGREVHSPAELTPLVPRPNLPTAQLPLSWPRLGQPPGCWKGLGEVGVPPTAGLGTDGPEATLG